MANCHKIILGKSNILFDLADFLFPFKKGGNRYGQELYFIIIIAKAS